VRRLEDQSSLDGEEEARRIEELTEVNIMTVEAGNRI
jgi:hypothetical protein